MNVRQIIETIKSDLETTLPAIIDTYGASPIDIYSIGFPPEQEKRYCCVRYGEHSLDDSLHFVFMIHLSLYKVSELESYDYINSVDEYLTNFFIKEFELKNYKVVFLDNFQRATTEIFFEVTLEKTLDDCD